MQDMGVANRNRSANRLRRLSGAALLAAACALPAVQADAAPQPSRTNTVSKPSAGAMAADVLIARPLGLAATVVGSALWVVSLPFSALGGNVNDSAEQLVIGPAAETFARCLGCTSSAYKPSANE